MRMEPISAAGRGPAGSPALERLTFVGHATTLLELGATALLTDPVLGRWVGPLRRQVPTPAPSFVEGVHAVLISHLHRDHLDRPSLRRLRPGTVLVVPRGAGSILKQAGGAEVEEVGDGDTVSVAGVTITAVPAVHDSRRDPWGPRAQPLGYLLDSGRRRVYFPGDTDLFPGMAELRPLDLALLPVWGWGPTLGSGHMNPERAARALELLAPRLAVPIHWGTLYPPGLRVIQPGPLSEPPRRFQRFAAEVAPDVHVRVLAPGESLTISPAGEA